MCTQLEREACGQIIKYVGNYVIHGNSEVYCAFICDQMQNPHLQCLAISAFFFFWIQIERAHWIWILVETNSFWNCECI